MEQDIINRLAAIKDQLEKAAVERWGHAPQIIAVSKTIDPSRINLLRGAGIKRLGENRVQEIMAKLPYLDASFQIDLIGRLQNNKVKYIIDKVGMIQSVDRDSLAAEIDRRAQQHALCMPVLVQVNIGNEPQKGGIPAEETRAFVKRIAGYPGLEVRGLMAVMPNIDDEDQLRVYFRRMRELFDTLREDAVAGTRIEELSMGMSGDYLLAAEEGATHVRIGSAIFGSREFVQKQDENSLEGDLYS